MIVPVKVYNFVKSNLHLIIFGLSYVSLFLSFYIDEDGTEELLSIYRRYIINGDNFDLTI